MSVGIVILLIIIGLIVGAIIGAVFFSHGRTLI